MSTTVYIWDNKARTGHASMDINGTYVSNTPDGKVNIGVLNPFNYQRSREDVDYDYDDKHHDIVERIYLDGLDTEAMLHLHEQMNENPQEYNLYLMNCSTVVAKLLMQGFSHSLVNNPYIDDFALRVQSGVLFTGLDQIFTTRADMSHKPHVDHVIRFLEGIVIFASRNARAGNVTRKVIQLFVPADAAGRVFVWNPAQVQKLAHFIQAHSHLT